jgi:hypothetical protein
MATNSIIKTGDVFYRWTVIEEDPIRDKSRNIRFICRCACGTIRSVTGRSLIKGKTKSCRCIYRPISKVIERTCPVCGKKFKVKEHVKKRFCSRKCGYLGKTLPPKRSMPISLTCHYCNKKFDRSLGDVNQSKRIGAVHWYCSSECQHKHQRGENAPGWDGGSSRAYKFGYHTLAYKKWREKVFKRDDFTCQICSVKGGYLHAHHKRGFAHVPESRFDVDNGITLCKKCHMEVHSSKCAQTQEKNKLKKQLLEQAREITIGRKKANCKYLYQSAINFGVSA